ncbi:MAG: stage II sporulation protein M [Acidimicrobiia bacterium]
MKLNSFVEDRQARWDRLQSLITAAGKRPEKLALADIRALASGYRGVAADLAIARRHFPGDPLVGWLEKLAVSSRALVYERQSRRESLVAFFADGYWQLLWARRRLLAVAAVALLGPGLIGMLWGLADPDAVTSVVPPEFLWVTEEQSTDQGRGVVGLAGFSTFVMVNNIRVTLAAFALGITFGLGTGYLLLLNGLILGGVSGLALGAGNGEVMLAAIAAHGVLELTCIVVGGAAGLSLGWAMLRPGKQTRREALTTEAANAFRIAGGTVPWLVVAGLIEGFVSRVGLGSVPTTIIGLLVGGVFWTLLLWRGTLPFSRIKRNRIGRV